MLIRIWRFITLLFTSLNMAMGVAHLLQLPPRMNYDAAAWWATLRLYRLFGPPVGATIEGGAVLSAAVLPFLVRKRDPAFRWTLSGTLLWLVAAASWWLFIAPVNAQTVNWTPATIPADWKQYRDQWEYTHAARAILMVVGLGAFIYSVLVETPSEQAHHLDQSTG